MISNRQNNEQQIIRLGAQRQRYATAKRIFGAQLVLSGPIVVVLAVSVLFDPNIKSYAALYGIVITFLDITLFTPWQKSIKDSAARIQELFDCYVLQLDWNQLKVGKRPDPELIKEQSDNYQKRAAKMPPLPNWYSVTVDQLPLHIGRIVCQRSNCWWDAALRRRYASWLISIIIFISLCVLAASLKNGLMLEDLVLKVLAPLLPLLVIGMRQFTEQREAAERLDKLKDYAEKLFNDAIDGKPESEMTHNARLLQDEIFEHRKRAPLIFDKIYKYFQRNHEEQMNHGVVELVGDAKNRLR